MRRFGYGAEDFDAGLSEARACPGSGHGGGTSTGLRGPGTGRSGGPGSEDDEEAGPGTRAPHAH